MEIPKTLEIAFTRLIEVFKTPLSIRLICDISTPTSLAKISWVKPFCFRNSLSFAPNLIKKVLSLKYFTCKNVQISKLTYKQICSF